MIPPENFQEMCNESPCNVKSLFENPLSMHISELESSINPSNHEMELVDTKGTSEKQPPVISVGEPESFSYVFPKHESLNVKPNENFHDFKDYIMRSMPLIEISNPQKYGGFLVETLRRYPQMISLAEFYELLYNSTTPWTSHHTIKNEVNHSLKFIDGEEGFAMCNSILGIFGPCQLTYKNPERFDSLRNKGLLSVNYYHFLRTFLAIKILFDSIEEVDEKLICENSIPRISIYKAYRLICKNLTSCYTAAPNPSKFHKKIVVGKSQFGRIMKLVYPNLRIRRLGRRGSSMYHYLGIRWNRSIIDAQILNALENDKVKSILRRTKRDNGEKAQKSKQPSLTYAKKDVNHDHRPCSQNKSPFYTFVTNFSKFPNYQCSPRSWEHFPGKIPKPSPWALEVILTSLKSLLNYGIDMEPLIRNFKQYIFVESAQSCLIEIFVKSMNTLISAHPSKESYVNLYLIMLLLIFPIVLASDEEIPCDTKAHIREILANFCHRLKLEIKGFPESEMDHLTNFSHIIKKMIHISEMTLSCVPTNLVNSITQEIFKDLLRPSQTGTEIFQTANEEIVCNAVRMALNAYSTSNFRSTSVQKGNKGISHGIEKSFLEFSEALKIHLLKIPQDLNTQELDHETFHLPFKIFFNLIQFFHEKFLLNQFVLMSPIRIIKFIWFKRNIDMQMLSFPGQLRDRELSKEKFKTWWVYSTLTGEYIQILAEIVAMIDEIN